MVDGVAILVKKEPITLYDIKQEMQISSQPLNKVVDTLIRKKLESQEIKERHIKVDSQEVLEDLKNMAKQNNMTLSQLYSAMSRSRGLSEKLLKQKVKEKILNQKLYSAIAFSKMSQPTLEDEQEYYKLHSDEFSYYENFSVIVYSSADKNRLQEKIDNPMFYSPQVQSESTEIPYKKLNPQIADILTKTPIDKFTPIIPSPNGIFMSFFVKEKSQKSTMQFDKVKAQINAALMQERRQKVLNDYFMRLRMNADIEIIRLDKS
jgi:parvulin-like peptidyl-prolyl isomerase